MNNDTSIITSQTDLIKIESQTLPSPFIDSHTEEQIRRLAKYDVSENTLKAYMADLFYISQWIQADQGRAFVASTDTDRLRPEEIGLPLPLDLVKKFVYNHLDGLSQAVEAVMRKPLIIDGRTYRVKEKPGPHSINTVRRRLSALSVLHAAKGVNEDNNPCLRDEVRRAFTRKRRENSEKNLPSVTQKDPLTKQQVWAMVEACEDDLAGIRDRAILAFGFASGGRRRSEISEARAENLITVDDGYVYQMPRSKTDQYGHGADVPVLGDAAILLDAWLSAGRISSGPLFRSIDRHGNIGEGLSDKSINLIVKKYVAMIGLDPAKYGGHSLRSGFATESGLQEIDERHAMQLTQHKDRDMFDRYRRLGSAVNNPAARMFDRNTKNIFS